MVVLNPYGLLDRLGLAGFGATLGWPGPTLNIVVTNWIQKFSFFPHLEWNRSVVDGAFDSIVGVFLLFELGMALVGCGVLQLLLCLLAVPCKRASCWEAREVAADKLPVLLWWSLVPAGTDFKEWVLISLFLGVVHLCSEKCVEEIKAVFLPFVAFQTVQFTAVWGECRRRPCFLTTA